MQCQINRPQSLGSPAISESDRQTCDLRPYATAWQIAMDLDGYLRTHEFMGVVRHLMYWSDFVACLAKLRQGRLTGVEFMSNAELTGRNENMNPRIYWLSHISGGGRFMRYRQDTKTVTFLPGVAPIIKAALNFHRGCGAIPNSIAARSWTTPEDYFENIGGRRCPGFLASGKISVVDHEGQRVAILVGYKLEVLGAKMKTIGGAELCNLPLLTACFHDGNSERLLRIDRKIDLGDGKIELEFGLGRPVIDPAGLLAAIEEKKNGD